MPAQKLNPSDFSLFQDTPVDAAGNPIKGVFFKSAGYDNTPRNPLDVVRERVTPIPVPYLQETAMQFRERTNDKFDFLTTADIGVFMKGNPQGFREALESDEKFRANVQELMKTWDSSAIFALSYDIQNQAHVNSLSGRKVILENVGLDFFEFLHNEVHAIGVNPYHQLGSFNKFQEKRELEREREREAKRLREEELAIKAEKEKELEREKEREQQLKIAKQMQEQMQQMMTALMGSLTAMFQNDLSIYDAETQKGFIQLVPKAMQTDNAVQNAAMGLMALENPDVMMQRIAQYAMKDETFARNLQALGVEPNDLGDMTKLNKVYQAVGLMAAEKMGGFDDKAIINNLLSENTQNVLEQIRDVVKSDLSAEEKRMRTDALGNQLNIKENQMKLEDLQNIQDIERATPVQQIVEELSMNM